MAENLLQESVPQYATKSSKKRRKLWFGIGIGRKKNLGIEDIAFV